MTGAPQTVRKTAELSPCGKYRYKLGRHWADGGVLTFVMLNPSTADDEADDPTIRRCMSFAMREGAAGIHVVNLFALRATDPNELKASEVFAFGPANFDALTGAIQDPSKFPIVCAWGAHTLARVAGRTFLERAKYSERKIVCLGKTKDRSPRHPLYVPSTQKFEAYP